MILILVVPDDNDDNDDDNDDDDDDGALLAVAAAVVKVAMRGDIAVVPALSFGEASDMASGGGGGGTKKKRHQRLPLSLVYGRALAVPHASHPHAEVVRTYASELLAEAARLRAAYAPLTVPTDDADAADAAEN